MSVSIAAIDNIPMIAPLKGASSELAGILAAAIRSSNAALENGDVIVIAQKIISKAEGRQVALSSVTPSPEAEALALEVDKDPRIVELILSEATRVVRKIKGVLIVEHRLGFVHANAGIDQSNVEGEEQALLLPENSDVSAHTIRDVLEKEFGVSLGVIIADSMGRAWRKGTVGFSIGSSGTDALLDMKGTPDLTGRPLEITEIGRDDELAAAAGLVMGQAGEGKPVVLIKGAAPQAPGEGVGPLLRGSSEDLFR